MGERGPLPNPNARRRNRRAVTGRHIDVARPEPPDTLEPEGRAQWDRVVPELEAMGLLTRIDRGILVRYVTLWADWVDVNAKIAATSKLVHGARNTLVRNPLWIMRNDLEDRISSLEKQMGLTANARIRAGVAHDVPDTSDDARQEVASIDAYRKRLSAPAS